MADEVFSVLCLCTGNSARSTFAESLITLLGRGQFCGYSAGSHPKGAVNRFTIDEFHQNYFKTDGLRSKDWAEFEGTDTPQMDFVFTVCDKAAAEVCPVWPGQPMTAHWGVADPAEVEGDDIAKKAAFHRAFAELQNRISIFVNLPFESLDRLKLQKKLDATDHISVADAKSPGA